LGMSHGPKDINQTAFDIVAVWAIRIFVILAALVLVLLPTILALRIAAILLAASYVVLAFQCRKLKGQNDREVREELLLLLERIMRPNFRDPFDPPGPRFRT